MILRILKPVGNYQPGAIVNINKDVADGWIAAGQARFHDGSPFYSQKAVVPSENKMVMPSENKEDAPQSESSPETEGDNIKLPIETVAPVKAKAKAKRKSRAKPKK